MEVIGKAGAEVIGVILCYKRAGRVGDNGGNLGVFDDVAHRHIEAGAGGTHNRHAALTLNQAGGAVGSLDFIRLAVGDDQLDVVFHAVHLNSGIEFVCQLDADLAQRSGGGVIAGQALHNTDFDNIAAGGRGGCRGIGT